LGLWAYTGRLARSIGAMILVQIVVLLILFPWAYRNHNLSNRWIFTSTSVGGTLITGLGEHKNPWGFGPLDRNRGEQAAAQGIPSAWTSEADLYFRDLFIKSIKENPLAFFKAIAYRIPFAIVTPYDWGYDNPYRLQLKNSDQKRHINSVLNSRLQVLKSRPFYIVAAYWDRFIICWFSLCCFICIGILFVKEWYRKGFILFLICPHLYAIFSHLVTHMSPRFILPSMYCWIFGLGYVLARGWQYQSTNRSNSANILA
jgi:hypothetical protein